MREPCEESTQQGGGLLVWVISRFPFGPSVLIEWVVLEVCVCYH